jgi:hypothetical protein
VDQRLKALDLPDAETGLAPGDADVISTMLFAARREAIDAALSSVEADIAATAEQIPESWREALDSGARAEWQMARGVTDQIELRYRMRPDGPSQDSGLREWSRRAWSNNQAWQAEDPASYSTLEGEALIEMLHAAGFTGP